MADLPSTSQHAIPSKEAGEIAPTRPSLLPAFEPFSPFSSSPALPRSLKRKFDDTASDRKYYPTPVPTSSTGILPSSSPARQTRPGSRRTVSALSERAPLNDVPTLDLPRNGEPVLMGRSGNSSSYQLPGNRHISRVHVRAAYHAPDEEHPTGRVDVECLGWNGAKVHCRGEVFELAKGGVYVSDKPMAQIMVDVQNTRVMLAWPREDSRESPPMESRSPIGSRSPWPPVSPAQPRLGSACELASSPPVMLSARPTSPVSPTPGINFGATFTSTFRPDSEEPVEVYQDQDSEEHSPLATTPKQSTPACDGTPTPKGPAFIRKDVQSFVSEHDDFSEHDEENDPIVHSFGPFGDNIMSRLESFQSSSPDRKRKPLKAATKSPRRSESAPNFNPSPIKNHVINQLAFSRIHSLPLSTIHSNLPTELRGAIAKPCDGETKDVLTTADLKNLLHAIPCVGEISREGKDAAGKLLESEFYYVPEMDTDANRRDTVTQSLGKTSIRAARKQHKQYYWKRPRF